MRLCYHVCMRRTTTFRLDPFEEALLDAWAGYLAAQTGLSYSRAAVLRFLLRRAKPPEGPGPQSRVRLAYKTLFPEAE